MDLEQASRVVRVGPSSCRVEFSVPAALVAVVSAASASVSQPRSLFTAVTGPPSPCFGSQPRLYWTAQAHLVGSKGMSLKNNQTLPRGSEWGVPGWSRSSRLSTCPLTPSSVPRHSRLPGWRWGRGVQGVWPGGVACALQCSVGLWILTSVGSCSALDCPWGHV